MKTKIIKILIISLILISFLIGYNMVNSNYNIERMINPDLPVLKDGWEGNIVINGRFFNTEVLERAPFVKVLKWKFSRNPQREEKRNDTFQLNVEHLEFSTINNGNNIVWLGHATFLININGISLITDPNFFNLPTSRRKVDLPLSIDSLTPIHYLLVSHDHRDHFDRRSVEMLFDINPEMEALVPLGGSRLFDNRKLRNISRQEAGWFQEYVIKEDFRVIFLPAKHWGRRGLNDFNRTLWGSFLIITPEVKILFVGDSAYDSQIFKEIREIFGDIDICLLPIGAYAPPFLMQDEHFNPEEAIQAFFDLGGGLLIPLHYGTYDLSDEPLGEPIRRLYEHAAKNGIEHKIKSLSVGEIVKIN